MVAILRRRKLGLTSCNGIRDAMNTNLVVMRNDKVGEEQHDIVFRWGCTSNVYGNPKIINKAAGIHQVNDKTGFRKLLEETELCPQTWFDINEVDNPNQKLIVRPHTHAQGRELYVCTNHAELVDAANRCGPGYYISVFIDKVAEYRVFVASGRAVWVAQKTPGNPDDVAWNVAKGGRFDNVRWDNWPLKAVKCAITGFNLTQLDFGGVDVMVDANGEAYILEINSAPSQTSPYRQSCVAKVFDYIVEKGTDRIPLVEEKGGYLKFIHPAVTDKARIGV